MKRIRLEIGLTQEQFSERSGFSQQYVSDLERGRRNPTVVTLFELATALNSTPVALLSPVQHGEEAATARKPIRRRRR